MLLDSRLCSAARVWLGIVAMLALAGWPAPPASAAQTLWPQFLAGPVSAHFTYSETLVYSAPSAPATCTRNEDYSYSARLTLKLESVVAGAAYYTVVDASAVTLNWSDQSSGSPANNCSYDGFAQYQQTAAWDGAQAPSGTMTAGSPQNDNLSVQVPAVITSCSGPDCPAPVGSRTGFTFDSKLAAPITIQTTPGSNGSSVSSVDISGTTNKPLNSGGSTGAYSWTYSAQLAAPTTIGPTFNADKLKAKADLLPAVYNARIYCTPTALGLLGFGSGVLLVGAGPIIGPSLIVAGALTAVATQPFCLATIRRVAWDYRRWKDPPDPSFGTVVEPTAIRPVRLPPCSRWRGGGRLLCGPLRAAETSWAEAAERVASIDQALATTMARESSALASSDQAAVNLQDAHLNALEKQEKTALHGETAAGKRIALLLRSHHIAYRLTKSQSSSIIAAVESVLAKQGITASALAQAGVVLKPTAIDVLEALVRG